MTIGERCATIYTKNKKFLLVLLYIVSISLILLCVTSCNQEYTMHYISYIGEEYPLKTSFISSAEDLNNYFSQEDYIYKGENYEEDISGFTKEYFDEKVLIPILYSKENYILKSVKIENNKVIVSLIHKSGNRPTIMPTLYFLELDKGFVGDATESEVIYTK